MSLDSLSISFASAGWWTEVRVGGKRSTSVDRDARQWTEVHGGGQGTREGEGELMWQQ